MDFFAVCYENEFNVKNNVFISFVKKNVCLLYMENVSTMYIYYIFQMITTKLDMKKLNDCIIWAFTIVVK